MSPEPVARAKEAIAAIEQPARARGGGTRDRDGARRRERARSRGVFAIGLERLEAEEEDDELAMTLRASRVAVGIVHATADPGDLEAVVRRG